MKAIQSLLNPETVAVIGASRDIKKLGRQILDNIIQGRYQGKIIPINPKTDNIAGLKTYHSVLEVPTNIDLAVIAIPSQYVLDVLKECGEKNVKSVVIISAGFSEIGENGIEMEYKIGQIAKMYNMTVLGPNCLGVISSPVSLNASFAKISPKEELTSDKNSIKAQFNLKDSVKPENIAFLSQSGALGTAGLDWATENSVGFSYFISLGNKTDLSENDFIKYLDEDENTKLIAFYLEDFYDGKKFVELASKTKKPIVVLKPGKSTAAKRALGSHTGSLASNDAVIDSALKQCGVLRAHSIEELFNVIQMFSQVDRLEGENIAIVTNAGGPGVFTTDAIEMTSLKLAKLSEQTKSHLRKNLPEAASVHNPVDILGDALSDRYELALDAVLEDKGVDAVLVLLTPQTMTEIEKTSEVIIQASETSDKFIIPIFIGGTEVKKGIELYRKHGTMCFPYPEDAVQALSLINSGNFIKQNEQNITDNDANNNTIGVSRKSPQFDKIKDLVGDTNGPLTSEIAENLLELYDIPVLRSFFPKTLAHAKEDAIQIKYPVVLKLVHPQLLHKTEAEAVKLDIQNENDMCQAFNELIDIAGGLQLNDYQIEMQHFIKNALEIIIGVKLDEPQYSKIRTDTSLNGSPATPTKTTPGTTVKFLRKKGFGHSIVFGMGGIYTEIFNDFSLRLVPLTNQVIESMIKETQVGQMLAGARGKKFNVKAIKKVIFNLSQLVRDCPQIRELDINPLFAKDDDVWVVDVKIIWGYQNNTKTPKLSVTTQTP